MLRTDAHSYNVKTVYPPQTKFAGGYNKNSIPTTNKVCGGYKEGIMSALHGVIKRTFEGFVLLRG